MIFNRPFPGFTSMDYKIVFLVSLTALFAGCASDPSCVKPEVWIGNGCCLDNNANKVCDVDETAASTPVTVKAVVDSASVGQNDEFTASVAASSADDVLGYSFRLMYDPAKLAVLDVSGGDYLSACTNPYIIKINNTGIAGIDAVCLGQTVSSGAKLADVRFVAIGSGPAALDLRSSMITLKPGNTPVNAAAMEIDASIDITA
jgi:hypothetical protein